MPLITDPDLFKSLLDDVDDGVYIVDRSRKILYWNHAAETITGYLDQQVRGRCCYSDMLIHCDTAGRILCGISCPLLETITDGKARECAVFLRHRHGHRIPVHVRARAIYGPGNEIVGAVELFHSTVASGRMSVQDRHEGHDPLTGAYSREYGEMKLTHELEIVRAFGAMVAWLRIDLDHVEELDHRFGHGLIDAAAKVAAHTLDANLDSHDVLVRWDRGSFRILLRNTGQRDTDELARKLAVMVAASNVEWWGDPMSVTVSVTAVSAGMDDTLETLEQRSRSAAKIQPTQQAPADLFRILS